MDNDRPAGPYVGIAGQPLRHLTGSETAEELAAEARNCFTCDIGQRAEIRRLVETAANLHAPAKLFKARTAKSPADGIAIVHVDYHPDAPDHLVAAQRERDAEKLSELLDSTFGAGFGGTPRR